MKTTKFYVKTAGVLAFLLLLTSTVSAQLFVVTNQFDENGNWYWTSNGVPLQQGKVFIQIDGGGIQYPDIYTYDQSLIGQTYAFYEPGETNLSDVIHFNDATHFSYYSGPGDPDMADLISLSLEELVISNGWADSIATNWFVEIGPEGNNHIEFMLGIYQGETQIGIEQYIGISDVPEPATLGLLALGGLALAAYRRQRK